MAFLVHPSDDYVTTLLGIFVAGGMALPLSPLHTPPELAHFIADARPRAIVASRSLASRVHSLFQTSAPPVPILVLEDLLPDVNLSSPSPPPSLPAPPSMAPGDPALMLYTSGTTGRPKGVVLSHAALAATCASLHEAWGWRRDDVMLHVLPLHHTHGVVVALLGALWAGATVRFATFDAHRIWMSFADATVFMAVPTIYAKLMEAFSLASEEQRRQYRQAASHLRLATSGSASLPASLLESFRAASGQTLLERYGMTEIGMALSNPLQGPRIAGSVGMPLPGVTVDIVGEHERLCATSEPGELRVRSPQLFSGYFGDPVATVAAYDRDGRFRTGDTGVRDADGIVTLLGRTSTDVLKSGGYKLSALEIEDVLRVHPDIAEIGVIGLPDAVWGDRVTACVVLRAGTNLSHDGLRAWAKDRLAPYKIPRALLILDILPRNAMGKLQKQKLKEMAAARGV